MSVQLEYLKSIPYFSELSSTELDSVEKFIFERPAKRGELILLEDDYLPVDEYLVKMMVWDSLSRLEDKEDK